MKVTVMSPFTADVTIAQVAEWLRRNGWVDADGDASLQNFRRPPCRVVVSIPVVEDAPPPPYVPDVIEEMIRRIAAVHRAAPGDVLREMSEVLL